MIRHTPKHDMDVLDWKHYVSYNNIGLSITMYNLLKTWLHIFIPHNHGYEPLFTHTTLILCATSALIFVSPYSWTRNTWDFFYWIMTYSLMFTSSSSLCVTSLKFHIMYYVLFLLNLKSLNFKACLHAYSLSLTSLHILSIKTMSFTNNINYNTFTWIMSCQNIYH